MFLTDDITRYIPFLNVEKTFFFVNKMVTCVRDNRTIYGPVSIYKITLNLTRQFLIVSFFVF